MILRWIGPRPPTISQSPCGTERGPRQILTYQLNTLPGASWRFVRLPWIQGGRKKEQRYDSLPTSYHYKSPKKYLGPQKKLTPIHVYTHSHTHSHTCSCLSRLSSPAYPTSRPMVWWSYRCQVARRLRSTIYLVYSRWIIL